MRASLRSPRRAAGLGAALAVLILAGAAVAANDPAAKPTQAPAKPTGATTQTATRPLAQKPAPAATQPTVAATKTAVVPAKPVVVPAKPVAAPAKPVAVPAKPLATPTKPGAAPVKTAPAKVAPDAHAAAPGASATAASAGIKSPVVTARAASARPMVTTVPVAPAPSHLDEQVTYQYNALGRRDPFQPLVGGTFLGNDVGGDAPVDVGGIKVVGIVWGAEDRFALAEDARGQSNVLRVGDKVQNGVVTGLRRDALIVELTMDGQSQSVVIPLTKKGDQSNANR